MTTTPDDDDKYCEDCGGNIPENTPHHAATECDLCEACAPTYQDIIDTPENFLNNDNEKEMTAEEAHDFVSAHLKMGGKLSDKVLNFGITLQ